MGFQHCVLLIIIGNIMLSLGLPLRHLCKRGSFQSCLIKEKSFKRHSSHEKIEKNASPDFDDDEMSVVSFDVDDYNIFSPKPIPHYVVERFAYPLKKEDVKPPFSGFIPFKEEKYNPPRF